MLFQREKNTSVTLEKKPQESATEVWTTRAASTLPFFFFLLALGIPSSFVRHLTKLCGQQTLRSYGWAYWCLWWADPRPPLPSFLSFYSSNRKQENFILQSAVHPQRPGIGMCIVGRNQGWQIKAEPCNGKVLLPVAVFAAQTLEAIGPPSGGLSVTDGTVVESSVKGVEEAPPQSRLLNSMN